jgi:hypothetical protein
MYISLKLFCMYYNVVLVLNSIVLNKKCCNYILLLHCICLVFACTQIGFTWLHYFLLPIFYHRVVSVIAVFAFVIAAGLSSPLLLVFPVQPTQTVFRCSFQLSCVCEPACLLNYRLHYATRIAIWFFRMD